MSDQEEDQSSQNKDEDDDKEEEEEEENKEEEDKEEDEQEGSSENNQDNEDLSNASSNNKDSQNKEDEISKSSENSNNSNSKKNQDSKSNNTSIQQSKNEEIDNLNNNDFNDYSNYRNYNNGILKKVVSFQRLPYMKPSIVNIQQEVQGIQQQINGMINKLQFSKPSELQSALQSFKQTTSSSSLKNFTPIYRHELGQTSQLPQNQNTDFLANKSLNPSIVQSHLSRMQPPKSQDQGINSDGNISKVVNQIYNEAYTSAYNSFAKQQYQQQQQQQCLTNQQQFIQQEQQPVQQQQTDKDIGKKQEQEKYNEKMDQFIDEFRKKLDLAIMQNQSAQIEKLQQQQDQQYQQAAYQELKNKLLVNQERQGLESSNKNELRNQHEQEYINIPINQNTNQTVGQQISQKPSQVFQACRSKVQISQESQKIIDNYYKYLYRPVRREDNLQLNNQNNLYQKYQVKPKQELMFNETQQKFLRNNQVIKNK